MDLESYVAAFMNISDINFSFRKNDLIIWTICDEYTLHRSFPTIPNLVEIVCSIQQPT